MRSVVHGRLRREQQRRQNRHRRDRAAQRRRRQVRVELQTLRQRLGRRPPSRFLRVRVWPPIRHLLQNSFALRRVCSGRMRLVPGCHAAGRIQVFNLLHFLLWSYFIDTNIWGPLK